MKTVEDLRQIVGVDADAAIAHAQNGLAGLAIHLHGHEPFGMVVDDGVEHQVGNDLVNARRYSMHTRRQLRALYGVGVRQARYYEMTLFGRLEETHPRHEISLTLDQRERWGTLEARVEWSQYLHDRSKSRLEADGELSLRIARGLSVAAEVNASRIRDQLSLPARGATPEEVLLRLRQLQSGYEYGVSFSLTYTFGSIFSSVVNPRFGQ